MEGTLIYSDGQRLGRNGTSHKILSYFIWASLLDLVKAISTVSWTQQIQLTRSWLYRVHQWDPPKQNGCDWQNS